MRLRNMNCVRFLHRALPRPRAGSESTAGPGLALNSTCGIRPHSGFKGYRLYAETPLSLLWMRDGVVPLTYGVPPPGIACRVSAYAPPPHAIETVLPFHSSSLIPRRSRHVFRPYCLSLMSIQKFLQETRPRQLSQNFAIENRYLNSYKCTIQLFGRVVLRSLQLVQFETSTPLYTLTRIRHPS